MLKSGILLSEAHQALWAHSQPPSPEVFSGDAESERNKICYTQSAQVGGGGGGGGGGFVL